jgi:hypothetical protein
MNARAGIEDKRDQLLWALGVAEQFRLCSDDDGRGAAILQLRAILKFLEGTAAVTIPLVMLNRALEGLERGTKPAMLAPKTVRNRPRDDWVWQRVKIVAATIMDQLQEYADLSRKDAAKDVEKVFSQYGLSTFRGRRVTATAISKWRDQARRDKAEFGRDYKHFRSIDAEVLAKEVPLENKRQFLLARRLPILLIGIGARGTKAAKTRQQLISELDRRIPKKATS